jgi:hypothetical protein
MPNIPAEPEPKKEPCHLPSLLRYILLLKRLSGAMMARTRRNEYGKGNKKVTETAMPKYIAIQRSWPVTNLLVLSFIALDKLLECD